MTLVPGSEKLCDVAHLWSSTVKWEVGQGKLLEAHRLDSLGYATCTVA